MRSQAAPPATGPADRQQEIEREANEFFEWLTSAPGPVRHVLRSPIRSMRSLIGLRRLPVLDVELANAHEGLEVFGPLHRSRFSRVVMAGATAVLRLPDTPEAFSVGSSMQTLRRKSRAAVKAGVHWRPVDDQAKRLELLRIADEAERTNTRPEYRMDEPVLDGLEHIGLWLVAYGRDEQPLLLSVTPVDGDWAVLRYFRTVTASDDASLARYYMTQVLAEELIRRGVRYLTDSVSPLRITSGLRHFQRMVGFRLVRTRPSFRGAVSDVLESRPAEPRAAR